MVLSPQSATVAATWSTDDGLEAGIRLKLLAHSKSQVLEVTKVWLVRLLPDFCSLQQLRFFTDQSTQLKINSLLSWKRFEDLNLDTRSHWPNALNTASRSSKTGNFGFFDTTFGKYLIYHFQKMSCWLVFLLNAFHLHPPEKYESYYELWNRNV